MPPSSTASASSSSDASKYKKKQYFQLRHRCSLVHGLSRHTYLQWWDVTLFECGLNILRTSHASLGTGISTTAYHNINTCICSVT